MPLQFAAKAVKQALKEKSKSISIQPKPNGLMKIQENGGESNAVFGRKKLSEAVPSTEARRF